MNEFFPDLEFASGEESPPGDLSHDQPIGRRAPPPLRIHHILIITVVAAVLLSVNQQLLQNDVMGLSRAFTSGWGTIFTIGTAISTTLVMFGFSWRRSGYAFFDVPGHWLLVAQSLGIGLFLAVAISLAMRAVDVDAFFMLPINLYSWGSQLVFLGLYAYVTFKVADSVAWRIYFVSLALLQILMFFLSALMFWYAPNLSQMLYHFPLLFLLIAAIGDRMKHRARDWPHWIGVTIPFAIHIAYGIQAFIG